MEIYVSPKQFHEHPKSFALNKSQPSQHEIISCLLESNYIHLEPKPEQLSIQESFFVASSIVPEKYEN